MTQLALQSNFKFADSAKQRDLVLSGVIKFELRVIDFVWNYTTENMVELGKGKPNLRELQETVNVAIAFSWSNDSSQAPLWLQTSIHCFTWKKGNSTLSHFAKWPTCHIWTYPHEHVDLSRLHNRYHTHTYTVLILALLNCVWLQPSEKSLWPISQLKYAQPRSNLENKLIIELHDSLCKTPIDRSLTVEHLAFLRSQYQPFVG